MATEKLNSVSQSPIHSAALKPLITAIPNNDIASSILFSSSSSFPFSLKDTSTASTAEAGSSVSHILRKINRAERFGISVHLSEAEKRYSRAERFGIDFPDALEKSEELKRKARAERFGFSNSLVPADEEAKKKARIARFTPVSESNLLEEGKRKARSIRFSNLPLKSQFSVSSIDKDITQHVRVKEGTRRNSARRKILTTLLKELEGIVFSDGTFLQCYEHIAGTKATTIPIAPC